MPDCILLVTSAIYTAEYNFTGSTPRHGYLQSDVLLMQMTHVFDDTHV